MTSLVHAPVSMSSGLSARFDAPALRPRPLLRPRPAQRPPLPRPALAGRGVLPLPPRGDSDVPGSQSSSSSLQVCTSPEHNAFL